MSDMTWHKGLKYCRIKGSTTTHYRWCIEHKGKTKTFVFKGAKELLNQDNFIEQCLELFNFIPEKLTDNEYIRVLNFWLEEPEE